MPAGFEPLTSYRWPSGESFWIGILGVRLPQLASQLGFRLEAWDEEGLGPATGACLRLQSGRVVLLQELAHLIDNGTTKGPDIWVDLQVVATVGGEVLRRELLEALDLPVEAVAFEPGPIQDANARERLTQLTAWLASRTSSEEPPTASTQGAT